MELGKNIMPGIIRSYLSEEQTDKQIMEVTIFGKSLEQCSESI